MSPAFERERIEKLMMAALDGELDASGRAELERALAEDAELRAEWERLGRVTEVTRAMRYVEPPNEVWDAFWASAYNRVERGLGWILVLAGATVLAGWGAWALVDALLAAHDVAWPIRLAIVAVVLGGLVLLVSVAREKLFAHRRDPYREIQR